MSAATYDLDTTLFWRGKRLAIYHVSVNGRDEFRSFVEGLLSSSAMADINFAQHFVEIIKHIGVHGTYARPEYFQKIRAHADLWEIRRRHGRTNHRFYGFMVGNRAFYVVRHADKRGQDPDPQDLQHVERVARAWHEQNRTGQDR